MRIMALKDQKTGLDFSSASLRSPKSDKLLATELTGFPAARPPGWARAPHYCITAMDKPVAPTLVMPLCGWPVRDGRQDP